MTIPTEGIAVVGAGVGRTGTHSLKIALERLVGGRCHHMVEMFPSPEQKDAWTRAVDGESTDWPAVLSDFRTIVDWPGAAFWRELSDAFPEALVLLSVRDPEAWYRSANDTIFIGIADAAEAGDPWMEAVATMVRERFCDRLDDRDAVIDAFLRHNDAVRTAVPPERLLEWTVTDGWEPICDRLGVPVPDEPFPVTNSTDDFRVMVGLPPIEG